MWSADEDPFKPSASMLGRYSPGGAVKIDLPAPFTGDGSQSFLSWARQLEVAVGATAGGGQRLYGGAGEDSSYSPRQVRFSAVGQSS